MNSPESSPVLPEDVLIEAGQAERVMFAALANLTAAVIQLERVSMAIARGLDATAANRKEPTP
ncbi:MAG: hypothetical protein ABTD50_22895 [Polyangiaceae bacterium]|jgi:hypothetical protein